MPQETKTYCVVCVKEESMGLAVEAVEDLGDQFAAEIAIILPPGKGEGATAWKVEDFLCEKHLATTLKALRLKSGPPDFEPFEVDADDEGADDE